MPTLLGSRHALARAVVTTIVAASALALLPLTGTHAATPDGQPAFAWGNNSTSALGSGAESSSSAPAPVLLPAGTTSVVAGPDYAFAITDVGDLFAWGANTFGQLGTGDHADVPTPTAVPLPDGLGVVAVATAGTHALALADDGSVWAWGRNHRGQLGLSDATDRPTPTPVTLPGAAVDIAVGRDHSAVALENGAVLTWGAGDLGRLGNGSLTDQSHPVTALPAGSGATRVAAGDGFTVAVVTGGEVLAWGDRRVTGGDDTSTPVAIAGLTGVIEIDAGSGHVLALDGAGTVFAWGGGELGQLGTDDPSLLIGSGVGSLVPLAVAVPAAEQVSTSGGLSLVLTRDGRVFAWGDNGYGQLGDSSGVASRAEPTAVADLAGAEVTAVEAGPASAFALVTHGGATRLVVGPPDPALVVGRGFTFTVTAVDAFGIDLGPVEDVSLALDGVACEALTCTPPATGSATVVAISPATSPTSAGSTVTVPPGSLAGFASVTVSSAPPPDDGGGGGPGGFLGLTGSGLALAVIVAAAVLLAVGIAAVLITRSRMRPAAATGRHAAPRAIDAAPTRRSLTGPTEKD